jgi:hypothetical protein
VREAKINKNILPFAVPKFSPLNPNVPPHNFINKLCLPHACLLSWAIINIYNIKGNNNMKKKNPLKIKLIMIFVIKSSSKPY